MYYDGTYDNGLYHGAGEFAEEDGSLYVGSWHLGLRQGQGNQVNNRERHEYSGSFAEDEYHGNGKCTWVNGSVYEGAWVKGTPNGIGVCVLSLLTLILQPTFGSISSAFSSYRSSTFFF